MNLAYPVLKRVYHKELCSKSAGLRLAASPTRRRKQVETTVTAKMAKSLGQATALAMMAKVRSSK